MVVIITLVKQLKDSNKININDCERKVSHENERAEVGVMNCDEIKAYKTSADIYKKKTTNQQIF